MRKAYVMMTRIPIPGHTKTRLMPHLSPEQCAKLHFCFLYDLWDMTKKLKDTVDIYLTYSDEGDLDVLTPHIPPFVSIFPQVGQTLGDKMNNAIENLLKKGYDAVILTGCDIPSMTVSIIENGFRALEHEDIVIAPTKDGGYYLIGCKDSIKEIFSPHISWGEKSVFTQTTQLVQALQKSVYTLPELDDIDTLDDIIKFKLKYQYNMPKKTIPFHTFSFIQTLHL